MPATQLFFFAMCMEQGRSMSMVDVDAFIIRSLPKFCFLMILWRFDRVLGKGVSEWLLISGS